jgi:hypothetical protein
MTPKKAGKRVAAQEEWIAVRVPIQAHENLKRWAADEERSMSWIVRRLVLDALADRNGRLDP